LTKADIVDTIATATGLTKVETEAVVDGFISTVISALKDGKNIEIRGFGSFKVKKRKGRVARNPRTGEQVMVGEHWVPLFKVSKEVKLLVNEKPAKGPGLMALAKLVCGDCGATISPADCVLSILWCAH